MSDNLLPFEIQEEIMKRLPVESLIQFRSVSKPWKSLIDSSRFIKHYTSQHHHLLVRYEDDSFNTKYVSVVDDDESFPHQRFSLTHPALVNAFDDNYKIITGCPHGLLCFHGYCVGQYTAVIWNISVIKSVTIVVPNVLDDEIYCTLLGFGVCLQTSDPKILKITQIKRWSDTETIPDTIPYQVEVLELSTRAWRPPYSTILPRKSIQFGGQQQVIIDGACYLLATDRSAIDGETDAYNLIISFHMTSEEFTQVNLPDSLVYDGSIDYLTISNMRESLVVLEQDTHENLCYVWSMGHGVSKSFTKVFTIYTQDATIVSVPGFRKSGEPVIEVEITDNDDDDPLDIPSSLVVYDSKSENFSNFGFDRTGPFHVHSYMETLLLLDQP